jgi:ABC-type lipoprotein release transport system permease subunit
MKKKSQNVDDTLFLGVLSAITVAMLIWMCIMINGIQKDVEDIGVQLDSMRGTLIEMLKAPDVKVDTDISAEANQE